MIDLGVSKFALIAVVALVVVGPERLPKIGRMAGNLFSRAQRYMSEVRSEVNRQMELDEFKKLREESISMFKDAESTINSTVQEVQLNLSDQAASSSLVSNFGSNMSLDEAAVYRESLRQGRDSWRIKRGNRPIWFKHFSGTRTRIQSGAARMKRYRRAPSIK